MKKLIDILCVVAMLAVVCTAGYVGTTEFLNLRNRVERIEQKLQEPIEFVIQLPDARPC